MLAKVKAALAAPLLAGYVQETKGMLFNFSHQSSVTSMDSWATASLATELRCSFACFINYCT